MLLDKNQTQKMCFKVEFRRLETSPKEQGIAVGNDIGNVDIIIDINGKIVTKLWDYKDQMFEGLHIFYLEPLVLKREFKNAS